MSDITETRVSDSWTQVSVSERSARSQRELRVTKLTADGAPSPARDQSEAALWDEDTRPGLYQERKRRGQANLEGPGLYGQRQ